FLVQMGLDTNHPTNDGQPPRFQVQIANVIWQDAAGNNHLTGFDPETGLGDPLTLDTCIPAPATLALLGLAGLAGIRRRRR
ncbi:MAG: PEP-CTERM sorting domain-containing protein, partial [Planctomycetota bacterium]